MARTWRRGSRRTQAKSGSPRTKTDPATSGAIATDPNDGRPAGSRTVHSRTAEGRTAGGQGDHGQIYDGEAGLVPAATAPQAAAVTPAPVAAATSAEPQVPGPSEDQRPPRRRAVPSTRAGTVWVAAAFALVILVAVIIFIAQNSQHVHVSFVSLHGQLSLALALLAAAVLGALFVTCLGAVRIIQLRRLARRNLKATPPA